MLRPDRGIERVYLHRAPVDMRKQMDGLSILAQDVLRQNPMSGTLFVFVNARRNKLKILYWERNGFVVWYKRLERERFAWPGREVGATLAVSMRELEWLLEGFDLWSNKPHETLHFESVT